MPWQQGNSGIAGHRDTLFWPLQHVRAGDRVRLETPRGDFEYVVTDTRIVEPTAVSVLAPTRVPSLTLMTCYPFRWIGSAPQRFIVRAERVEGKTATR
jgi:sortase A